MLNCRSLMFVCILLAVPSLLGCPVRPVAIDDGFAFFEVLEADTSKDVTGPEQVLIEATLLEITPSRIPADFFGDGSDALTATVPLVGVPLVTTPLVGTNIGTTDTLITILGEVELDGIGSQAATPAKFAQSRLASIEPVTVTYNGGQDPETWQLAIDFDFTVQTPGTINITRTGRDEGTVEGTLPVVADLTFVRESDSAEKTVELSDVLAWSMTEWILEPNEVMWPAMYRTNMVPALNKLPFIGRLFQRRQARLEGNELLFFVTPTVIMEEQ